MFVYSKWFSNSFIFLLGFQIYKRLVDFYLGVGDHRNDRSLLEYRPTTGFPMLVGLGYGYSVGILPSALHDALVPLALLLIGNFSGAELKKLLDRAQKSISVFESSSDDSGDSSSSLLSEEEEEDRSQMILTPSSVSRSDKDTTASTERPRKRSRIASPNASPYTSPRGPMKKAAAKLATPPPSKLSKKKKGKSAKK